MRRTTILLVGLLFFALFLPMKQIHAAFPDVPKSNWSYEHVESLYEKGLIYGYPNGKFGPNDAIIRQNVARIIGRWLIQEQYITPEDAIITRRFYDIPLTRDEELLNVTALLSEEGIFNGAAGKFDLDSKMTREQMALVLVRTIQNLYGEDLIEQTKLASFQSKIKDIQSLPQASQQAIIALEYAGITNNTKFLPTSTVTRAEFATFINRTISKYQHLLDEELDVTMIEMANTADSSNEAASTETKLETEQTVTTQSDQLAISEELSIEEESTTNPFFNVAAGVSLYASQNGKRVIATMANRSTFPVLAIQNEGMLYFEIGKERYYVYKKDVTYTNEGNIANSSKASLGFIRLKAPFTLYADEAITIPYINGTVESRFKVKDIENNVAQMEVNGQIVYVSMTKNVRYAGLPYQMLQDETIYKKGTANAKFGQLAKGVTFLSSGVESTSIHLKDSLNSYEVSAAQTIEVDDLSRNVLGANELNATVAFKQDTKIFAQNGQSIGTILKGEKVVLHRAENTTGFINFAGIPGSIDLSNVYHSNIVDGSKLLPYTTMVKQLKAIHAMYPSFTELIVIGQTVEGRDIYALRLGNGKREMVMDASIHAREYMTTNVLMEMIDDYSSAYAQNTKFEGYDVKALLDKTAIWFIPMVNIDGVTLVQNGVNSTSYKNSIINMNGSNNVARWKANIRGVDLNRNFDGPWQKADTEKAPSWSNFKGHSAFSEPESKALRDFFKQHQFQAYVSYHSSGSMLYYWNWQTDLNKARDYAFASKLSNITGYYVMKPLYEVGSGSSADWFIRTYKKPGITMEISPYVGDKPVPLSHWSDVWKRNKTIGLLSAKESEKF